MTTHWLLRSVSGPRTRVVLAALFVALLAWWHMLREPLATGFGDYQQFHHNWEFGRIAWSRHGELPLWNPYYCGGISDFGDSQSQVHHPLFFLSFLIGTTLALKLFVLLHALAGLTGMYLLARRELSLSEIPAGLAAVAWATSGFFAWHCGTGHGGFVAFQLTPWLLLAWRQAIRDIRFSAAVAGVLTLALLAGGAYVFPYMMLLLAFDGLPRLLRASERGSVIRAGLVAGALTALLGAWRLVPVLEHLRYYPRTRETRDALILPELLAMLTRNDPARDHELSLPGHVYHWPEYGSYVGWGVLVLATLGAGVALFQKRSRWLVVGALLFGSLACGSFSDLAPWRLLKRLPLYTSLQAPSRFMFAFLFFLCLLAALALHTALERAKQKTSFARPATLLAGVIAVMLALPIVLHHREVLRGMWSEPPVPRGAAAPDLHLIAVPPYPRMRGELPPKPELPGQNRGTGYCYSGMDYWQASGLWAGDGAQVQLPLGGKLVSLLHTTRNVQAELELSRAGRVVLNKTASPGWVASSGKLVTDHGRLAVDLEPGRHQLRLRYAPSSVTWAALATLVGVLLAGWLWLRRPSDRVLTSLVSLAATFGVVAYWQGAFAPPGPEASLPDVGLRAGASDFSERHLHDRYAPAKAIDGRRLTEWLTPDARSASLDLWLTTPSPVATVAVRNAKNLPHNDRATRAFRIEAYLGRALVTSARGKFEPRDPEQSQWQNVALNAPRADRVRIVVESWEGLGGGIAEVRLF